MDNLAVVKVNDMSVEPPVEESTPSQQSSFVGKLVTVVSTGVSYILYPVQFVYDQLVSKRSVTPTLSDRITAHPAKESFEKRFRARCETLKIGETVQKKLIESIYVELLRQNCQIKLKDPVLQLPPTYVARRIFESFNEEKFVNIEAFRQQCKKLGLEEKLTDQLEMELPQITFGQVDKFISLGKQLNISTDIIYSLMESEFPTLALNDLSTLSQPEHTEMKEYVAELADCCNPVEAIEVLAWVAHKNKLVGVSDKVMKAILRHEKPRVARLVPICGQHKTETEQLDAIQSL